MHDSTALQPLLSGQTVVLAAPTQVWTSASGDMGSSPIHGVYFADTRVVRNSSWLIGDRSGEHISTQTFDAKSAVYISLQRHLDDDMADPRVRAAHSIEATIHGVLNELVIASALNEVIDTTVVLRLQPDLTVMEQVKTGRAAESPVPPPVLTEGGARWKGESITVTLEAAGARVEVVDDGTLRIEWPIHIPARGQTSISWAVAVVDVDAVVEGVDSAPVWRVPQLSAADDRLARWVDQAMSDLDGLRIRPKASSATILAAGAPWFFTIFGRDSLWAARFLLPTGTELAADTLRVLAGLQGLEEVDATAEQPGKIMHELRKSGISSPGDGFSLPPLYYGTVDATALWVCVLHDAWKWGMPEGEVEALIPNMLAALAWMRDYGDADGDMLIEYVDSSGHGLSNQGWKDSGDSIQWRDGTLAEGPIALCEVQAYSYEAAMHAADMLDHFGHEGGDEWRGWAARLRQEFHNKFWIEDAEGAYPATALDASKRPVDTVTSNIGHLLGTGILDEQQAALVAKRLVGPRMNSGYGLRTMSTDASGYWPLSYHCGSVWTHDTAIAITGLSAEGFFAEAAQLVEGLLEAAVGFGYRMPELYSGDGSDTVSAPVPYPASCRPQAWAAAASIAVATSVLGLTPSPRDD